jgi:hypothetical protein
MVEKNWKTRFHRELDQAEAARRAGKEGRARVCSRRAAGILVEEYFKRQGSPLFFNSAYDYLKYLASMPEISPRVTEIVDHLLMRVAPDYSLPIEVDLVQDARSLERELLGDET